MNDIAAIKEIANAILYEGYLLYPYRTSAIKNRQRWTFGVVYPQGYSLANGNIEPWRMRTECLVNYTIHTRIDVHVRFLHLLVQQPKKNNDRATSPMAILNALPSEKTEEGIEREIAALNLAPHDLFLHEQKIEIHFPQTGLRSWSGLKDTEREQYALQGIITIAADALQSGLLKLNVQIDNLTPHTRTLAGKQALLHSFVSTHTILQVRNGTFISLIDPPTENQNDAQNCYNLHTWPVFIGEEGTHNAMLSSPIILYDYPQIAPESPGPLFDGTEIDEILTLRILTLTDEEKEQMRQGDPRVREILERTEALTPEQFMQLHGTLRNIHALGEETGL